MIAKIVAIAGLLCMSTGCAVLSDQYKEDEYDRTMYTYETALQLSDFKTVCQFVDPAVMSRKTCVSRFGDIKIAEYALADMTVDEDRLKVHQEIEIEYYPLDNIVLKKTQFSQSWSYQKDIRKWILENGPPQIQ